MLFEHSNICLYFADEKIKELDDWRDYLGQTHNLAKEGEGQQGMRSSDQNNEKFPILSSIIWEGVFLLLTIQWLKSVNYLLK